MLADSKQYSHLNLQFTENKTAYKESLLALAIQATPGFVPQVRHQRQEVIGLGSLFMTGTTWITVPKGFYPFDNIFIGPFSSLACYAVVWCLRSRVMKAANCQGLHRWLRNSQRIKQDKMMLTNVQNRPRSPQMKAHFLCEQKQAGVLKIGINFDVPLLQCWLMSLQRAQKH